MHIAEFTGTTENGADVKVRIHFNTDCSGDVMIETVQKRRGRYNTVRFPAKILLQFTAYHYILPQRQEALGRASLTELLLK